MNKKIIALAVAAVATGTNASVIYDDGQTTVGLKGEVDVYLSTSEVKDHPSDDYETDPDIDLWAKIQMDAEHMLTDTVKAFASFEIENGVGFLPGDNDNKDLTTDDEYFGMMYGENFGFALGEVGDFGDSLDALLIDNTNEGVGYIDDVADKFESRGHGVSLKYETDALVVITDAYLHQDKDLDTVFGISGSYNIAGFNIGAAYQDRGNRESYSSTNDNDNDIYGIRLGYGNAAFAVDGHYVVEQLNSEDIEVLGIAAHYRINAARLYTSAYTAENKDTTALNYDDVTAYTLGVDYEFSDNLLGFVEYTAADNYDYEKDAESTLALAGVYFYF